MRESDETVPADWLAPILELEDPVGILSVYVDADPALAAGDPPAWHAHVRAGVSELAKEARLEWPRADRMAFEARLAELEPELASFLGRRGASRGRAFFAGIGRGDVEQLELHAVLPSIVAFGRQAVVLPLVAVEQCGRPAGVAQLSWARIVLLEWQFGVVRDVGTIDLEPGTDGNDDRPATNPAVRQPFPERDQFETRVGSRVLARTREAGTDLGRRAAERGWDVVVLDGDARLVDAIAASLGSSGPDVLESPQPLSGTSRAETADRVGAALRDRRHAQENRLVDQLGASAAATRDVTVVERALAEGRVDHLLLKRPAESSPFAIGESLFRRAMETRAQVTMLDASSAALGPDGVAALLRW